MRWFALALFVFVLPGGLTACGGSGDEGPEEPTCALPGTLQQFARAGENAPGTGGGTFDAFPTAPPMGVAEGGWGAFVAPVRDGTTTEVAYVVTPEGGLVRALARGDTAEDASAGTIDAIDRVWVSPQGWLLALVSVAGGGPAAGLVSVHVASGAVAQRHGVIYDDEALDGFGGTLATIHDEGVHLAPDGNVLFRGTTTGGEDGFWSVNHDGSSLSLLVGTGDTLGGVGNAAALHASAVDPAAQRFAVLTERDDAGGTRGIYAGRVGFAGVARVEVENVPFPDSEGNDYTLDQIPDDQLMVVYGSSADPSATSVLFVGLDETAMLHLLIGSTNVPSGSLARQGGDAPVPPGTTIDLGTYGELGLVANAASAQAPVFWADLDGAVAGITFGLFGLHAGQPAPVTAFVNNAPAPSSAGGEFSPALHGAASHDRIDVSADGSLAFVNVLTNGTSGVFWTVRCPDGESFGQFAVALSGETTPAGSDTFAATAAYRVTVADGVMLFRAPLDGAGSGIFRQGP